MRAGACVAQQTFSPEAASVLKHSLSLARRRGHAQVTPLHVAATLLTSKTSIFKRACLKSQPHHQSSHVLQCRALELCFSVALNRLQSTPSVLLHAQPSLSNALVAALKRAQAHQRRGSIDQQQQQQQQQSVIAVKVELEQLILSILDDPSVSRVMIEAGFSSTLVKNSLEESNSVFQCYNSVSAGGGIYSTPNSPPNETHKEIINSGNFWDSHLLSYASEKNPFVGSYSFKEDVKLVLEILLRKKRKNAVIIGDSISMVDGVVAEFIRKMEGGDVPDELKSAHLIKFQFSSVPLKLMKREEVELNVADLKKKIDSFASDGGVLIYTGDLKWTVENCEDVKEGSYYSPVEHLVTEMAKLLALYSSSKVWLMATATYQTYLKCQMRQPSLDTQWNLQPVSVPSCGLGLSLAATRCHDSKFISFPQKMTQELNKKSFRFDEKDDFLMCCQECKSNYDKEAGHKSMPFWLKPQAEDIIQLRIKYNKLCHDLHQRSHDFNNFTSATTEESYPTGDRLPNKNSIIADSEGVSFGFPSFKPTQMPRFRRQQSCHIEFSFSNGSSINRSVEPNLDSLKVTDDKEVRITLGLGNSTYFYEQKPCEKFEFGADFSEMLQENVPWQYNNIPLILRALSCGSREKFLLIQGNDSIGKRRLAVGVSKSMFGSSDFLFCIKMRDAPATQKREILYKALRDHESLVVLIEDVESADPEFAKFLVEISETRSDWRKAGREMFILTTDGDESCSRRRHEAMESIIQMKLVLNERITKRKADWDLPNMSKSHRNSSILDLNIKADDDLAPEIPTQKTLEIIQKNSINFTLDKNSEQQNQAIEMFMSKIKRCFDETSGSRNTVNFSVDTRVLEEILWGSGFYLNSLFEEWLKEVFQPSLQRVGTTEEGKRVSIRLCLGGGKGGESCPENGFMGTNLPKTIQVHWTD